MEASRGDAAVATWTFRGGESRGRDVDIPWRRIAATPRLRLYSVETKTRPRPAVRSRYLEIREFVEELCYFMGSLAYAIGSVLFEPIFSTHFNNPDTKQDIEQWAVSRPRRTGRAEIATPAVPDGSRRRLETWIFRGDGSRRRRGRGREYL